MTTKVISSSVYFLLDLTVLIGLLNKSVLEREREREGEREREREGGRERENKSMYMYMYNLYM